MGSLRNLVASLGTPGAVRNAEHAVHVRRAEERAIQALAERMQSLDARGVAAPAA